MNKEVDNSLETPEQELERINDRRKRMRKRLHVITLNRSDRRFLKRLTGEVYPVDSKTDPLMAGRVRYIKNLGIALWKKRKIAKVFLTTGHIPAWVWRNA